MDLKLLTNIEIYNLLRTGDECVIDTSDEPSLSKTLSYYIDDLELRHTYKSHLNLTSNDWDFFLNIGNVCRLYFKYRYLLKLEYAWAKLRWIKVKTDTMPPCKTYTLCYVHEKANMPSSL